MYMYTVYIYDPHSIHGTGLLTYFTWTDAFYGKCFVPVPLDGWWREAFQAIPWNRTDKIQEPQIFDVRNTPPKSNIDTKNDGFEMYLLSNMAILDIYVRFQGGKSTPKWLPGRLFFKGQP